MLTFQCLFKKTFLVIFLIPIYSTIFCQIYGNGDLKNYSQSFVDIRKIEITFPVQVEINCDEGAENLWLNTDSNVLNALDISSENGTLTISPKEWVEPTAIQLKINAPKLETFKMDGYGEAIIKGVASEKLAVFCTVGEVTIEGMTGTFRTHTEVGKIKAFNLKADRVYAKVWSYGVIQLNPVSYLEADAREEGTIIYEAAPEKLKHTTRSGGVILERSQYLSSDKKQPVEYIRFALKNNSNQKIDAFVRGPKNQRFSYGFPLKAHQKRKENWPVGSKVYKVNKIGVKQLLYTLKVSDAGKNVELF